MREMFSREGESLEIANHFVKEVANKIATTIKPNILWLFKIFIPSWIIVWFSRIFCTSLRPLITEKIDANNAKAYLVNTGWNGTGKRISIKDTRRIIDAILDGSIEKAETKMMPVFNLEVPLALHDVDPAILDPRDTYADASEWDKKANELAELFIKNFAQYTANEEGKALVAAGPQL